MFDSRINITTTQARKVVVRQLAERAGATSVSNWLNKLIDAAYADASATQKLPRLDADVIKNPMPRSLDTTPPADPNASEVLRVMMSRKRRAQIRAVVRALKAPSISAWINGLIDQEAARIRAQDPTAPAMPAYRPTPGGFREGAGRPRKKVS